MSAVRVNVLCYNSQVEELGRGSLSKLTSHDRHNAEPEIKNSAYSTGEEREFGTEWKRTGTERLRPDVGRNRELCGSYVAGEPSRREEPTSDGNGLFTRQKSHDDGVHAVDVGFFCPDI